MNNLEKIYKKLKDKNISNNEIEDIISMIIDHVNLKHNEGMNQGFKIAKTLEQAGYKEDHTIDYSKKIQILKIIES